jgi:hypothetical protein
MTDFNSYDSNVSIVQAVTNRGDYWRISNVPGFPASDSDRFTDEVNDYIIMRSGAKRRWILLRDTIGV